MEKVLENLIEDATRISDGFCNLARDTKDIYSQLSDELDVCGWEIQKSINNVREVKKFIEEYYDI